MIFTDKIKSINNLLNPEFDKLFMLALEKQAHKSDLLLLKINGFFEESLINTELNPHVIGPNKEGLSEQTHYTFIDMYRNNRTITKESHSDYLIYMNIALKEKMKLINLGI